MTRQNTTRILRDRNLAESAHPPENHEVNDAESNGGGSRYLLKDTREMPYRIV